MSTHPKRVSRFGGALYVAIPAEHVRQSGLVKGDYLKVTYTGKGWWVEKMELPNQRVLEAARRWAAETAVRVTP